MNDFLNYLEDVNTNFLAPQHPKELTAKEQAHDIVFDFETGKIDLYTMVNRINSLEL